MRRTIKTVLVMAVAASAIAATPSITDSGRSPAEPLALLDPVDTAGNPAPHGEEPVAARVAGDVAQASSLLATSSARIEDRVVPDRPQPVRLDIERLGVNAPVFAAGAGQGGGMEVPDGIDEVAWYEFGSAPGEPGSAVLAAHVDMAGLGPGVFYALHTLRQGDRITISFDDGATQSFEVFEELRYRKDNLDTDRIFDRSGPATLTLVTCGGAFNPSLGRYDSNVVVYAAPVDGRAAS